MLMPASTLNSVSGSTGASAEESSLGLTPQQKDTTWTKLFVGGLPYHTSDKSLRDHFKVYGEIEEAVVITDRQTSKSRGYGFVIMSTRQAAELACKANPIIDGRKANVNLAILGAKPRGNLAATAFPLAIRAAAGYPGTTLLNAQGYQGFGIQPGSYIYQPAYNGTQILQLPAATANPLAALTGGLQHQFYDYHQQQAGLAVSAASQATLAGSHGTHFAAPSGQFFATDPYSQAGYIAASQQAATQAAVHHPYAAYALPQLNTSSGTTSTVGSIPYPYAAVAQDSRIQ